MPCEPNSIDVLTNGEVGPASVVDPNASAVVAPAIALPACRSASLLDELHTTAGVRAAIVPAAVVGRASEARRGRRGIPAIPVIAVAITRSVSVSTPTVSTSGPDSEIRTAAVIDPHAATISAPAIPFPARRTAALLNHLDAASCVGSAVVTTAVFR